MKNSEKFAFIVIGIAILYCIFVIIFALYKVFNSIGPTSLNFYYFVIVLGIISVFFLSVILRLSNNFKINFSILILTITIFIYCSEIFLFFKFNKESNLVLKKFDNRTKIEVINDFNKMGQKAYPSFYPHELIEKNGIDCKVIPANVDENSVKESLTKEGANPEIISKNLAELKAN